MSDGTVSQSSKAQSSQVISETVRKHCRHITLNLSTKLYTLHVLLCKAVLSVWVIHQCCYDKASGVRLRENDCFRNLLSLNYQAFAVLFF